MDCLLQPSYGPLTGNEPETLQSEGHSLTSEKNCPGRGSKSIALELDKYKYMSDQCLSYNLDAKAYEPFYEKEHLKVPKGYNSKSSQEPKEATALIPPTHPRPHDLEH